MRLLAKLLPLTAGGITVCDWNVVVVGVTVERRRIAKLQPGLRHGGVYSCQRFQCCSSRPVLQYRLDDERSSRGSRIVRHGLAAFDERQVRINFRLKPRQHREFFLSEERAKRSRVQR